MRPEVFAVYLGYFAAALVFTIVFPFASEMVIDFGVVDNRDKTGLYVGLIATCLMIGRFISSPIWGYIIDVWGRKPVTQLSLIFMTVLSALFGISKSLTFALIIRLLLGLLSPLMISSKTLIGELHSGAELPLAMANISIVWNTGSIAGSLIGGILSNPVQKGFINSEFLEYYPYLLVNLTPGVLCLIAWVIGQIYLKETLVRNANHSNAKIPTRSIPQILRDPKVLAPTVVFVIGSFNFTSFQELVTLFCWAKADSGGMEFTTTQIGYLLGGSSIILLLFQRKLYLFLVTRYGSKKLCSISLLLLSFITLLIPMIGLLPNFYLKFTLLLLICVAWFFFDFTYFTSVSIFLNNAVPPQELGKTTGVTMSLNCLSRIFAPPTVGFLFSGFIDSGLPRPLNTSVAFYLLTLIELIGFKFSLNVDKSTEESYKERLNEILLVDITEE